VALTLGFPGDLAEVEEVQDAVEEEEGAAVTVPRAAGTKILSVIPRSAPTPSAMRETTGDEAIKLNLTKCGGGGAARGSEALGA
jgi:hypothetical protein